MKSIISIFLALCIISCQRQVSPQAAASLNVVDVAVNSDPVIVNTLGGTIVYATFPTLGYGSNTVYTVPAGNPVISIVLSSDTTHPIFDKTLPLSSKGIYSLYLAGQSPNYDTLLLRDTIPYRSDSTAGVRFINLSPNSNPIVVSQPATPNVQEFGPIGYKQITGFKTYPALSTNTVYDFNVNDAATGTLLATYELTTPTFSNVTLVFMGLVGATDQNTPAILQVNNF